MASLEEETGSGATTEGSFESCSSGPRIPESEKEVPVAKRN